MTNSSPLNLGPAVDEYVLRVREVSKCYQVWKDPSARLKVPAMGVLSRCIPPLRRSIKQRTRELCHEFTALSKISFDLPRGTSMAVIGRNGSGKSTLLQIIAGTLQPTHGQVECHGRIAALLELGSGFNPDFSGRDNVYMSGAIYGLDADEISRRIHEVEEFAEIGHYIDYPVKTYSSGMMMRLAFSVQVLMDPEILIVDEALAVGDIFFQQKCFERMRQLTESGTSILFVSHDLVTVSQFTQTAMILHGGKCAFLGDSGVAVKEFLIMERTSSFRTSARVIDVGSSCDGENSSLSNFKNVNPSSDCNSLHPVLGRIPLPEIDLNTINQIGKENAEFTLLSVYDSTGDPSSFFVQGSRLYLQCEVRVHTSFECLSVGVGFKDRTNTFVHGKLSIQHGIRPAPLNPGEAIAFLFSFELELGIGQYSLDIGIIDIDKSVDLGIPVEMMEASITRACFVDGFSSIQIAPRPDYNHLQHQFFGLSDLHGECVQLS